MLNHVIKSFLPGIFCQRHINLNAPAENRGYAANEIAVYAFLRNRIGFLDMTEVVEQTMQKMPFIQNPTLEEYFESDGEARSFAASLIHL